MAVQTTERTKCKRNKVKEILMTLLKKGLINLFMRPATWQFLAVQVPIWIDKFYSYVKGLFSSLSDWIS